jgi:thiopeptide-type bacteriocin biosynthesis protein
VTQEGADEPSWVPAGFFQLRTPLFPFDDFLRISEGLKAGLALAGDDAEVAVRGDFDLLRARLRDWLDRPGVREGIHLASPILDGRLDAWRDHPPGGGGGGIDTSLYKYVSRMTGRSTPFGLFAGLSVGRVGSRHGVVLAAATEYRRRVELDAVFVEGMARAVTHALGATAVVHPNPTLFVAAERAWFTARPAPGAGAGFRLEALEYDEALEAAVTRGREGASVAAVARAVRACFPGASASEAEAYVRELVRRDALVAEPEPAVTGNAPLDDLVVQVGALEGQESLLLRMRRARSEIAGLEDRPLADARGAYGHIAKLFGIPGRADNHQPFHCDLSKPLVEGVFHEALAREIHRGTLMLQRLFRTRRHHPLSEFRARFVERYEGREVPLLEALDEECGIGFDTGDGPAGDPSPLLEGLAFPGPRAAVAPGPALRWLLPLVTECLRVGGMEVRITEDMISRWEQDDRLAPPDLLPDAFAVIASVAAEDDEAVRAGRFRVLHNGGGTQGASLLGRFCQDDPALRQHVERYLRAEEALRPDAVFAEVVFRPAGGLANVTRRPLLRAYEIPALGRSGAPRDRQIPLQDLRVSVSGDRVVLRSGRLARDVIPRMASAYSAGQAANPGVVRFLSALQVQEGTGVRFSWGALDMLPVLPRVVAGRVVFALARWRIDPREVEHLRAANGAARMGVMARIRDRLGLPRFVALDTDGDSALPLDLENVLAVDVIARLEPAEARLTELFPGPDEAGVKGPEGRFFNEFVVPFIRVGRAPGPVTSMAIPPTEPTAPTAPSATRGPGPRGARPSRVAPQGDGVSHTELPGGAWCYAKLYGGRALADRLLLEGLAPLLEGARAEGAFDSFFFIRYDDPHPHVRLRVHGEATRLNGRFLPALQQEAGHWLDKGLIWKLELDSYRREVERYGGPAGIALAESVFAADSRAVLAMLESHGEPEARWRQTLLGMHHLLLDFGLGTEARIDLLARGRADFGREFGADPPFWARLGKKTRRWRGELEALLVSPAPSWIVQRSAMVRPLAKALRSAEEESRLTAPLSDLARACLHLHVNRAVRSSSRAQELVLMSALLGTEQALRARGPDDGGGHG